MSLISLCSCSPLLPGLDWAPSLLQVPTGAGITAITGGPNVVGPIIEPFPVIQTQNPVTTVMNPPTLPPVLPLILVAAVVKAILLGRYDTLAHKGNQ